MSDTKEVLTTVGTHYNIRLDESETATEGSLVLWLSRQDATIKTYILSKEGNGQTIKYHYHLYLEFFEEMKKDTLDKRVKRGFKNRGTTASIAVCRDFEKSRTYCVKDYNIIKTKGLTKEQIIDYKARSYQKGKKKPDMFKILKAKCVEAKITDEFGIQRLVFDAYKGQRMYYSHMKALVNGLCAEFNDEDEFVKFQQYCM